MGVILVAYERESEQAALEQLLTGRGHQVLKASNGLAALDIARREPPDLIVADIVLPRMDGFALCRKWKQDERLQSVPFLFYTRRHDDPKYERFALELGAERFLSRTSQPDTLAAVVDQLLAPVPPAAAASARPADDEKAAQHGQAAALRRAEQAYALSKQKLEQAHAQDLAGLKTEHERTLAQTTQNAERALAAQQAEHEQALARARQAHEHALEQATEKITQLSSELETLETSQQRLAAGEARFRRVFEANPLPMWLADHATRGFIAVNDAALKLYGYTRAEFLALTKGKLEDPAQAAAKDPDVVIHRTKAGATRFVALTAEQVEFDGRSADLVCACDLTQRIEREQAHIRAAGNDRTQIDALGDGLLIIDGESRIVDANTVYCRMTGYPREQLVGMPLTSLEQASVGDTTTKLQFVMMDGANRHETRHKKADGSLLDVEVSVGPLSSTNAQSTTMLVRDVTQRRRDLALQRSHQRQMEFLLDLFKQADGCDEAAIARRVVEQVAATLDSPLSYLFFVDPTRKTMTLGAWRDRTDSRVAAPSAELRSSPQPSLFIECIKARRAASSNDLDRKSLGDGLPELQRYLAIPMVADDQTIAILGIANRDAAYADEDQAILSTIAESAARILHSKRLHATTLGALQRTDVAFHGLIDSLVRLTERHDPHTAGSAQRVAALAVALAREAGLDGARQNAVRIAALLHDVGNVAVPAAVLAKPASLTAQETALMRTHAEEGCKLLADIDFGAPVAEIVFEHHEHIDGSGYPRGIHGEEIRLESRVLAIADAVEAMCSPRSYRAALGMEAALDEINKNAGTVYDLHLVTACTRLVRQRGFAWPE